MSLSKIGSWLLWASIALSSLLFLVFWTQLTLSTRLAADDFCAADLFRQHGLLGTVLWWREHHTGRWFAQGLVAFLTYQFLPTARVGVYAVGLLYSLFTACDWAWRGLDWLRPQSTDKARGTIVQLLIIWLLASTFALTPVVSETWFWVAGSAVHSVPLVLLLVLVAVLGHASKSRFALALMALTAILLGGCSETSIVLGAALLGYNAIKAQGARRQLALVGAVGLIASAAFALSAPGNFSRLHEQTAGTSLGPHQFIAALKVAWHGGIVVKIHSWLLLGAVSFALAPQIKALFPQFPRHYNRAFLLGVPLALAISILPAIVAFHGPFPLRILPPITFFAALWFGAICLQLGLRLLDTNRISALALNTLGTCAALGFALLFAGWIRKQTPIVKSASRTFDCNYTLIRASPPGCKTLLKVEKPVWQRWVPMGVPEPLPSHWISRCMSRSLDSCPLAQK